MHDEIGFLIREGTAWVQAQRDRHRPNARELKPEEKHRLAGFFTPEILDLARVQEVRMIENPAFFSVYEDAGRPLPLDFSGASGLALRDTILVVPSPPGLSLVFHELVHVVQDHVLGERYLEIYVKSWAEGGGRYRAIAHEDQAFELQGRFRADPGKVFSVEDEVRRRFAAFASFPGDTAEPAGPAQ